MSEFKMPEGEEKANYVKENFNEISHKYDIFNDLNSFYLHRYWKNYIARLVEEHNKNSSGVYLDLCCGTGDISLRLNKILNVKLVYSVDFSEKMLSVAEVKLKHFPKSKIQVGDATNLSEFPNESFDAVTVGFGLRNVKNLDAAISEINRVLKPGGIFINLDVGKVKNPMIKFFADFYFFKIVPIMGYLVWGKKNEMFNYLPESSLYYPGQEELKKILEEKGFKNVYYKNFVFGNAALHSAIKP